MCGVGGTTVIRLNQYFQRLVGKKRTPERGLIKCYSTDVLQISDMSHVLLHDVNLPYTWIKLSRVLVSNKTKEITAHTAKFFNFYNQQE